MTLCWLVKTEMGILFLFYFIFHAIMGLMKMTQFFKIALLLVSLGVVVYAMRLLQAPDVPTQLASPENPMALLLGSDLRPLNWCMVKVDKIELPGLGKNFNKTPDISRFCEVMIEPVNQNDLQIEDYQVVAVATGEGKTKKLERNSKGVFRVESFPFHSKQLEKQFY